MCFNGDALRRARDLEDEAPRRRYQPASMETRSEERVITGDELTRLDNAYGFNGDALRRARDPPCARGTRPSAVPLQWRRAPKSA